MDNMLRYSFNVRTTIIEHNRRKGNDMMIEMKSPGLSKYWCLVKSLKYEIRNEVNMGKLRKELFKRCLD